MDVLINIWYTVIDTDFKQLSSPLDVEVSNTMTCSEFMRRAKNDEPALGNNAICGMMVWKLVHAIPLDNHEDDVKDVRNKMRLA